MNAIRIDTTINEAVAREIPALRPLLGRRVELIALEAEVAPSVPRRKVTAEELLTARIKLPPGVGPITLDDIERGIIEGVGQAPPGPRVSL
jgi:hypothetical protein